MQIAELAWGSIFNPQVGRRDSLRLVSERYTYMHPSGECQDDGYWGRGRGWSMGCMALANLGVMGLKDALRVYNALW